jgi:predicted phosphodiesterase
MRFVHTADWQIGMKAASLGGAAGRAREERLAAAVRVVSAARENGAEFLLVAGDLFEDNAVDRTLVQRVADILHAFPGPVYLIPGNHDPLCPGSVWEHPAWGASPNLQVCREATPVPLTGGTLYPCPLFEKYSRRDPTAWIPPDGDGIRVGLAHGTVEGVPQDEPDYPIPRDAAARAGLDYLALGHWHSHAAYPGPDGAVRMAYSGTHETTRAGERDSGNALLVDIIEPGLAPAVTPLRTGGLRWVTMDEECADPGDLARVRASVEQTANPESVVMDVRLRGILSAEERDEPERIRELLAARFLWGRLDDSGLLAAPGDDAWLEGLPAGPVRAAAERLRDPGHPDPARAARALMTLFSLKGETAS